jgi:hypothetical protein
MDHERAESVDKCHASLGSQSQESESHRVATDDYFRIGVAGRHHRRGVFPHSDGNRWRTGIFVLDEVIRKLPRRDISRCFNWNFERDTQWRPWKFQFYDFHAGCTGANNVCILSTRHSVERLPHGRSIPGPNIDPLKYQPPLSVPAPPVPVRNGSDETLTLKIRRKYTDGTESKLLSLLSVGI